MARKEPPPPLTQMNENENGKGVREDAFFVA